jgi:hypothetical protein
MRMHNLLMRTRKWTAHRFTARVPIRDGFVLLATLLFLAGCVSRRYQSAAKNTPPAVSLNLNAQQPPLTAELNTLIVSQGPGSWRREAYWDEYVVSIVNQGQTPITIDGVVLDSSAIAAQTPGSDPWEIEKQSEKILKQQGHHRKIVADAGPLLAFTGLEVAGTGLAATALATGSSAAIAGATVAAVALPVFAVGSVVRGITAPYGIQKEFNRRRLAFPLELQPGETRQGSLFFPITPGPQRLELDFHSEGGAQSDSIDLAPLANLHFAEPPAGAKSTKPTPR